MTIALCPYTLGGKAKQVFKMKNNPEIRHTVIQHCKVFPYYLLCSWAYFHIFQSVKENSNSHIHTHTHKYELYIMKNFWICQVPFEAELIVVEL